MNLPEGQLTEAELTLVLKHRQIMGQFMLLAQTRQEAVNDIIGLALEARGFSPLTHEVDGNGVITAKAKPDVVPQAKSQEPQP